MKTKITNGGISKVELKSAVKNMEYRLLEKTKTINPYLLLLEENKISIQPLSLREVDVLKYLNEGCSNKMISERLFISPNTVKTHIRHIYTKLNINNRLGLKEKINYITT